jgi:hydroxymethylglutaryl-CoA lyase
MLSRMEGVRYVECPRDAWQALPGRLPLAARRRFLQACAAAGLKRLDAGSFVSPRAVPQLADSGEMLARLALPPGSEVLAIVANERGVERALSVDGVHALGLPLSVSPGFELRNVGRSLEASWAFVPVLRDAAREAGRRSVVYLSMGFGNPDGEPWAPADTATAAERLRFLGVDHVVVADTVGRAGADDVAAVLDACERPETLGLHLHARPDAWPPLLETALDRGVRWFEGALHGLGGCPFAGDALVGNLPTERVLPWLHARGFETGVDEAALPGLARQAESLARAGAAGA